MRRAKSGVRHLKDYQKVILYVYPKIDKIVKDYDGIIKAQASACFSYESAEKCAERIAEYILLKNSFLVLKDGISDILERFTYEELYLLEYKYFRRKKKLEGEFKDFEFLCNERTYFRKQARLLEKVNAQLIKEGFDETWFKENFSNCEFMTYALKKLSQKGCSDMTDKRTVKKLVCRNLRKRVEKSQSV